MAKPNLEMTQDMAKREIIRGIQNREKWNVRYALAIITAANGQSVEGGLKITTSVLQQAEKELTAWRDKMNQRFKELKPPTS